MARGKARYLCGTPGEKCTGPLAKLSNSLKAKGYHDHGSPSEAFNCHRRYLISEGYELTGSRELRAPDGSGIRVLTKKIRFGAKMRPGKEGQRNMPNVRHGFVCISK